MTSNTTRNCPPMRVAVPLVLRVLAMCLALATLLLGHGHAAVCPPSLAALSGGSSGAYGAQGTDVVFLPCGALDQGACGGVPPNTAACAPGSTVVASTAGRTISLSGGVVNVLLQGPSSSLQIILECDPSTPANATSFVATGTNSGIHRTYVTASTAAACTPFPPPPASPTPAHPPPPPEAVTPSSPDKDATKPGDIVAIAFLAAVVVVLTGLLIGGYVLFKRQTRASSYLYITS